MSASSSTPTRTIVPILVIALSLVLVIGGAVWAIIAITSTPSESSSTGARPDSSQVAQSVLPDSTRMGTVELRTSDLDELRAFYTDGVGLDVMTESGAHTDLGVDGVVLIRLIPESALPPDNPREAGLYHTAVLFPTQAALARAIVNTAGHSPTSFQGSADHRVSQAFYFADPDGNGVELYWDRPSDEWEWSNGSVTMGSEPLNPDEFVQQYLGTAATGDPVVGHVHLRVGGLDQARAFYEGVLGFAVTSEADGALFFAAGGYHHHMATNVWQSDGAGQRPITEGLRVVTVALGDPAALADLQSRAEAAAVEVVEFDGGIELTDPWGNIIRATV